VFKTSGPVNAIRQGENKSIYAIVGRSIFYQIDTISNKIVKCIKFKKHSITAFFCHEEQLVFGNTENKVVVYDLKSFDPDNPDVPLLLSRSSRIRS
jgi:hypothetical protein